MQQTLQTVVLGIVTASAGSVSHIFIQLQQSKLMRGLSKYQIPVILVFTSSFIQIFIQLLPLVSSRNRTFRMDSPVELSTEMVHLV